MDGSTDLDLHRLFKRWVSASKPPENGRARLLWGAAHAEKKKPVVPIFLIKLYTDEHSALQAGDWSQALFLARVFDHSIQSGMSVRVC